MFQVPALLRDGLAVVVSPLIALMDDQVATLEELGVAAAALNSTLSAEQQRDLAARIKRGEVKMLYLAPERLVQPRMLAFLQSLKSPCSPSTKHTVCRSGVMISAAIPAARATGRTVSRCAAHRPDRHRRQAYP